MYVFQNEREQESTPESMLHDSRLNFQNVVFQ